MDFYYEFELNMQCKVGRFLFLPCTGPVVSPSSGPIVFSGPVMAMIKHGTSTNFSRLGYNKVKVVKSKLQSDKI